MVRGSLEALGDVLAFLLLCTPVTLALISFPWLLWGGAAAGAALCATQWERVAASCDRRWFNWFEIAKLAGGVLGIFVVQTFPRGGAVLPQELHWVVVAVLAFNIAEAVVRDMQSGFVTNAAVGIALMATLPLRAETPVGMHGSRLFLFPLPVWWILLYSSWNAAFSLGFGYSWSTRFQLLTALLSSWILGTPAAWLGARCISLVLNMAFRSARLTYLFRPGASVATSADDARGAGDKNRGTAARLWGHANVVVSAACVYASVAAPSWRL